eukprot:Sdes_comp19265_c0_seq2m10261
MNPAIQETTRQFARIEALAEDILTQKIELTSCDKKRNSNREALTSLRRPSLQNISTGEKDKIWFCAGDFFLRLSSSQSQKLLQQDQKDLDERIEQIRVDMKQNMDMLAELEGRETPSERGFWLQKI